jgi:hypothetical protein
LIDFQDKHYKSLIPEAGLEPARLAASHFECDVSAIPPLGHNHIFL